MSVLVYPQHSTSFAEEDPSQICLPVFSVKPEANNAIETTELKENVVHDVSSSSATATSTASSTDVVSTTPVPSKQSDESSDVDLKTETSSEHEGTPEVANHVGQESVDSSKSGSQQKLRYDYKNGNFILFDSPRPELFQLPPTKPLVLLLLCGPAVNGGQSNFMNVCMACLLSIRHIKENFIYNIFQFCMLVSDFSKLLSLLVCGYLPS